MDYTHKHFIEAVVDIAEKGWSKSTINAEQKNWCCGQIIGRLPETWVREIFQAAVDGVMVEKNASSPSKDSESDLEEGEIRESNSSLDKQFNYNFRKSQESLMLLTPDSTANDSVFSKNDQPKTNQYSSDYKFFTEPCYTSRKRKKYHPYPSPATAGTDFIEDDSNFSDKNNSSTEILQDKIHDIFKQQETVIIPPKDASLPAPHSPEFISANDFKSRRECESSNYLLSSPTSLPLPLSQSTDKIDGSINPKQGQHQNGQQQNEQQQQQLDNSQRNRRYNLTMPPVSNLENMPITIKTSLPIISPQSLHQLSSNFIFKQDNNNVQNDQTTTPSTNVHGSNSIHVPSSNCNPLVSNNNQLTNSNNLSHQNLDMNSNITKLTPEKLTEYTERLRRESARSNQTNDQSSNDVLLNQILKLVSRSSAPTNNNTSTMPNKYCNDIMSPSQFTQFNNLPVTPEILNKPVNPYIKQDFIKQEATSSNTNSASMPFSPRQKNGFILNGNSIQNTIMENLGIVQHEANDQIMINLPNGMQFLPGHNFNGNNGQRIKIDGTPVNGISPGSQLYNPNMLPCLSSYFDEANTAHAQNMIRPIEAEYHCPVEGCTKTFRRKAYVKKHMELHSAHKAYGCDMCDVKCRQYAGLYIHYKGVHKLKLKKCNVRYYKSNDEMYTSLTDQMEDDDDDGDSRPMLQTPLGTMFTT